MRRHLVSFVVLLLGVIVSIISCGGSATSPTAGPDFMFLSPDQQGEPIRATFTAPPEGGSLLSGRVALPPGVQTRVTELLTGAGQATPGPEADFQVAAFGTAQPTFVLVRNPEGKTVLYGFLQPNASTVIGPRETIVATLFFALGGFTLPPETYQNTLSNLNSLPEIDVLTQELVALMQENPTVIEDGDAALNASLEAVIANLEAQGRFQARQIGPPLGLMNISPSGQVNGLELNAAEDAGSVSVTNHRRRRAKIFPYKADTFVSLGGGARTTTPLAPPRTEAEAFTVDATQNLGSVLSIIQQGIFSIAGLNDQTAFVPRTAGPVVLPPDENATGVHYVLVAVGSGVILDGGGLTSSSEDILRRHSWSQAQEDEWRETAEDACAAAFLFDFFMPCLDALCGGVMEAARPGTFASTADWDGAALVLGEIQNAFALEGVNFPGSTVFPTSFVSLILAGQWRTVSAAAGRMFCTNVALREFLYGYFTQNVGTLPASVSGFAAAAARVNTLFNFLFFAADTSAVVHDYMTSTNLSAWEVEVIKPGVRLTPEDTTATLDAEIDYHVEVPDVPDGEALVYHWSVSGTIGGTLTDASQIHQNQTDFDSTSADVTYRTPDSGNPPAGAQDVIEVEVFAIQNNVYRPVGRKRATVTFTPLEVRIEPDQATLSPNDDTASFTVVVDGARPGTRFAYAWTVPGGAYGVVQDSQGPVGAHTEEATIDYVLNGRPGSIPVTETLTVQVTTLNDDGFFRSDVGTATCEVRIEPEPCTGADGSPVFNGCGSNTAVTPSARPGDVITITFEQPSGGICGGNWSVSTNMPGTFLDPSSFPDPGARTARGVRFQLSDNLNDYVGLRLCPRQLGYYEFPSSTTGPYVYVRNGAAHDLIPYVVTP